MSPDPRTMAGSMFRFAPSPNGRLHLGHAYSALFTAQQARLHDGTFLVRIEDIDRARCKPEFAEQALDDLKWLGLEWPQPVRYQSRHMHEYTSMIDRLERLQLLYPCFCTRARLSGAQGPKDPDGGTVYPGYCRFRDCKHEKEPGCALLQAVDNGEIGRVRFESYKKILLSLTES